MKLIEMKDGFFINASKIQTVNLEKHEGRYHWNFVIDGRNNAVESVEFETHADALLWLLKLHFDEA